jgi:hypothetical protein
LRIQARRGEVAVAHPVAVVDHDKGRFEHHSRRRTNTDMKVYDDRESTVNNRPMSALSWC